MLFRRFAFYCALSLSCLAASSFVTGCSSSTPDHGQVFITQTSLPNVVAGNTYNASLTASMGVAPYALTLSSGTLPTGLAFAAVSNGATITGTATTVGSYTFTVTVKDSSGQTGTATYTVGVTGLSGQYFFYQQYYRYTFSPTVRHASSSSSSSPRGWPSKAMLQQAALHPRHHSAPGMAARINRIKSMHPLPAQGSFGSAIVWGSVAGALTLDGSGNITGGEYDTDSNFGSNHGNITGGTYSLHSDNSGVLQLQVDGGAGASYFIGAHKPNGTTFIDQTVATLEDSTDNETYIEYGDGQMMSQTPSALATPLANNWVFGMRGETCYECEQSAQGDLLTAGLLNFDGAGSITNSSQADVTTAFDTDSGVTLGGNIGTTLDAYGRTTYALSSNTYDDGALPVNYAVYTIDTTHAYAISMDQVNDEFPPYMFGPLEQQADLTFSAATLSGNYVVWGSSEDMANETVPDSSSDTQISLLTSDGVSSFSGSGDFNYAGNVLTGISFGGNYSVGAQGRVEVENILEEATHDRSYIGKPSKSRPHTNDDSDTASFVVWLVDGTHGFGLQQTFDGAEPAQLNVGQQASGTFSNSSISGGFSVGSDYSSTSASILFAGTATADGNGNLAGTLGAASASGGGSGALTATYALGANGRGTTSTVDGSFFSSTTFYVVSSGEVVATDTDGNPAPAIFDVLQ